MANILMINVPYSGHTNPTLPLAAELVKRGHSVVYVNSPVYKDKIEATGAEFVPYSNFPEGLTEQQVKTRCFKAAFDTAIQLTRKFDLLIYEMLFYPGKVIAEKLGIPCVRQFSQPAWSSETMGDASPVFKFFCKLIDMQVMGKKNADEMGMSGKTLIDSVLNDRPELNVVYVPKLFQSKHESFDERYVFVCPPMEAAIASHEQIPYDAMKKPIIYISMGSIIRSRIFCRRCIKAFAGKNLSVILNTGKIDPKKLGPVSRNIFAYSFVPQLEVLQKADLFITHCGMNSVNEAMSFGVPMLAMPIINDQIANAKRIAELGIGMRIRTFYMTANKLYRNALQVLNDTELKKTAYLLKEKILEENSFSDVVTRVEECIK
ncbi:hypothetical protein DMN77_03610 [Paenibacillus sp. 79R4]|uniref:macrolide family glycosyltransferase n=1 Tax=Paenibacillus sp. 79R4 TaxID=2212847 RepID=UPI0015BDE069|nr:macrolide family glycosyltransferase [Paenibacillus sp. 79R4]NWL86684.1 hypothetical protein [Paenibacillus sp. 79R4]